MFQSSLPVAAGSKSSVGDMNIAVQARAEDILYHMHCCECVRQRAQHGGIAYWLSAHAGTQDCQQ